MASTGSQFAPRVALERTASAIASARRATLADRYATRSFTVEWRSLAALGGIEEEWRELAANALEPNVFNEPAFALAAAPVFGRDAGAVLVWSGTKPRRLLGLFPARVTARRYGFKLPLLTGWTHPYAPLGTPLVERDAAEPVIAAWLAHLAADPAMPNLLLLPLIAADGPFAKALATILQRGHMPSADFAHHERALLAPPREARTHYIERTLSRHRRKELSRNGRRLADLGALLFTMADEPAGVAAALDDFFALEARGWKGEAGTAAAGDRALHGFMRAAVGALADERKVAINRLLLDGRAIAATVTLFSGDRGWFWKTAYDESFARYSPGMLLSAALTEQLIENASVAATDSVAAPNTNVLNHLWLQRLHLSDRLIAVRPDAPFVSACRRERLRGFLLGTAKSIRGRLRGRR